MLMSGANFVCTASRNATAIFWGNLPMPSRWKSAILGCLVPIHIVLFLARQPTLFFCFRKLRHATHEAWLALYKALISLMS